MFLQILDRVADGMAFGALLPCKECSGQLVFKSDAYYCTGDVTAWTKCMVKTQNPSRKEWVTPKVRWGASWTLSAGNHGSLHLLDMAMLHVTQGDSPRVSHPFSYQY
jgi:hypothetical protein